MTQIVIMPGGFHPFHAGHYALYNSARQAFPQAEIYVAATNDTSSRPFPFAVKEKLARLAGVEAGHFVQVKSPFQASEITSQFDPKKDTLIFVRSEKDATKPPQAGTVKKDGSPSYLQPYTDQTALEPFAQHAYMAYLPTVEFGPGMTSATEIRSAWPTLNDRRKTALVMSLYPKTQTNPKLAQNVVQMLDSAIGNEVQENQGWAATYNETKKSKTLPKELDKDPQLRQAMLYARQHYPQHATDPEMAMLKWVQRSLQHSQEEDTEQAAVLKRLTSKVQDLERKLDKIRPDADYIEEKWSAKYKQSINCTNPKGFSQKAHCAGRKK
jgi:hypothetical protein